MDKIDTFNKFMIGVGSTGIVFMKPLPQSLSKKDALLVAAWLSVLADDTGEEFDKVKEAVENT